MQTEIFKQIGLSDHQIAAYLYLLKNGPTPPPAIAQKLQLTRSNAYKVLDQLVEMGLVGRLDLNKKLHYKAEDPIALASIAAEERNRVIALEQNIKEALKQLRNTYAKNSATTEVQTYTGKETIKSIYEHQAKLQEPIHFIQSRADRIAMGFETMDYIRRLPVKFGTQRYGITPDDPLGAVNQEIDERSNLNRTWVPDYDYTAPVEWTVAGDELVIIAFDDKTSAIRIKNQTVAEAFRQLWKVLDKNLRANPEYKELPKKAKRQV